MNNKAWCFTLNNYTEDENDEFLTWAEDNAAYAVVGYELGEVDHTPHIQGYFRLNRNVTMRYG